MSTQPQYGHKNRTNAGTLWPCMGLLVLALLAVAVFSWTTARIGALYGHHPDLGQPHRIGQHLVYSPLAIWRWPRKVWDEPLVDRIVKQGMLAFGLPLMAGIMGMFALQRRPKATKDLHGTAHWADRKEIAAMGHLSGQGVYVGGWLAPNNETLYLRHNGPEHIIIFAPTRSGKGVGNILPTLLAWLESSVVLDIKGENYALTSGYLKSRGHHVIRLELSDDSGTTGRFNPLEEVRLDSGRAISDVQQIGLMILDPDGKGLSDYWEKAAFGFFASVILHCMITKKAAKGQTASLYDVSVMLEDHDREGGPKELFKEMKKTDHAALMLSLYPDLASELAEAAHIFIAAGAAGMLAKADKEMSGVVSNATANMSLYRDPIITRNTSVCDFRIADLMNREKPVNLYLVVSPADIDRLRPLLRIFMSQLMGRLTEKMEFADGKTKVSYRHRLLLMLDEFTSLGKLPIVERAVSYMAGYGIKGYFIVQDTKQLNATYGQDNVLMANCHVRIAYAPTIVETAEQLSKLAGTTTVVQYKKSVNLKGGGGSLSAHETSRPLLTPDECMRLPGIHKGEAGIEPGDMLIFTAGHSPIYGRQILHFIDPVFLQRSSMPPLQVSDSLYFERQEPVPPAAASVPEESAAEAYLRYLDDLPAGIEK